MRLVEAVVGELRRKLEDLDGDAAVDALIGGASHETFALVVHFGLDLLAHGAAQKIGFPSE